MNSRLLLLIAACLTAALLTVASCTSHTVIPPDPSTFTALVKNGKVGITSPGQSADSGTTVTITAGGTGSGTVGENGNVSFVGTADAETLTLFYSKSGQTLTSDVTVAPLDSLVTKPYFSTGSAPNDMELVDVSVAEENHKALIVVNSLDNSVQKFELDGTLAATASLPQFASPSYIADTPGNGVYVARNGDNILSFHSYFDLTSPDFTELQLTNANAAFAGPGKPAVGVGGLSVFVPQADILSFSPTVYGPGILSIVSDQGQTDLDTSGHNTVFAQEWIHQGGHWLIAVSAGELQFDEDFNASITTDSFIDIYEDGSRIAAINLGKIGASVMALNEQTGIAYLGNLITGDIYKVDLLHQTILRGKDNPIHLTDEHTYISDLELSFVGTGPLLFATSFNTDELYVVDPATDTVNPAPYPGPYDLSLDPDLLAGALAVEIDNDFPYHAYVLCGVANAVERVNLLPLP